MEKYCDMHLHSTCSDGSMTPTELAEAVKAAGLSAAILSDHNTVKGIREFAEAAKRLGFESAGAVEISTTYGHVLGLFLPEESWEEADRWLRTWEKGNEKSYRDLAANLRNAGFDVDYDVIQGKYPESNINEAHFARELMAQGVVSSVEEAFKKYLGDGNGYFVSAPKPTAEEAIEVICSWGGVPVQAHPVLNLLWNEIEEYLPRAKKLGLVGVEVYYSDYSAEDTKRMMEICRESGVLPSGGSDFHGVSKPEIAIGVGKGNLRIPYEWFKELEKHQRKTN